MAEELKQKQLIAEKKEQDENQRKQQQIAAQQQQQDNQKQQAIANQQRQEQYQAQMQALQQKLAAREDANADMTNTVTQGIKEIGDMIIQNQQKHEVERQEQETRNEINQLEEENKAAQRKQEDDAAQRAAVAYPTISKEQFENTQVRCHWRQTMDLRIGIEHLRIRKTKTSNLQ